MKLDLFLVDEGENLGVHAGHLQGSHASKVFQGWICAPFQQQPDRGFLNKGRDTSSSNHPKMLSRQWDTELARNRVQPCLHAALTHPDLLMLLLNAIVIV